jgi:hypothetical protein
MYRLPSGFLHTNFSVNFSFFFLFCFDTFFRPVILLHPAFFFFKLFIITAFCVHFCLELTPHHVIFLLLLHFNKKEKEKHSSNLVKMLKHFFGVEE